MDIFYNIVFRLPFWSFYIYMIIKSLNHYKISKFPAILVIVTVVFMLAYNLLDAVIMHIYFVNSGKPNIENLFANIGQIEADYVYPALSLVFFVSLLFCVFGWRQKQFQTKIFKKLSRLAFAMNFVLILLTYLIYQVNDIDLPIFSHFLVLLNFFNIWTIWVSIYGWRGYSLDETLMKNDERRIIYHQDYLPYITGCIFFGGYCIMPIIDSIFFHYDVNFFMFCSIIIASAYAFSHDKLMKINELKLIISVCFVIFAIKKIAIGMKLPDPKFTLLWLSIIGFLVFEACGRAAVFIDRKTRILLKC